MLIDFIKIKQKGTPIPTPALLDLINQYLKVNKNLKINLN